MKPSNLSAGYLSKNSPDDCCCKKIPEKYHYHFTIDSIIKKQNKNCDLCDDITNGYHFHYKCDCMYN